jgi:arsenite-transporting ATPase
VLKAEKNIENEELLIFPGFEELLSLIRMKEIYDEGKYDVLIIDCAPTGETMSLLKFPDLFKWWMEKFFPMKKKGTKLVKPIVEATLKIPMPNDEIFDDFERLYEKIDDIHQLMLNKEIVSIRIVTTPEKIVVKEAKRSFSYLHLFDYNVDSIIINKVFSTASLNGYFEKWADIQEESIADIYDSFKGIPIFKLELLKDELRKYEKLEDVGKAIYGDISPEDILFVDKIFTVEKEANGYNFEIRMPFVDKNELQLSQKGDEIVISIKNERRCFVLPPKLRSKEISGAKYNEGKLIITFK